MIIFESFADFSSYVSVIIDFNVVSILVAYFSSYFYVFPDMYVVYSPFADFTS